MEREEYYNLFRDIKNQLHIIDRAITKLEVSTYHTYYKMPKEDIELIQRHLFVIEETVDYLREEQLNEPSE